MRSAKRIGAASVAAAAAIAFAATTAVGQDGLPEEGDFVLTFSLVEINGAAPIAIGPNQMVQAVHQVAHLFNDAGEGGFIHYAVGDCATLQVVDVEAGTVAIDGYCSYRDGDGDRIFESMTTNGPVQIGAIALDSEWTGGTGKYEGIGGTFTTELFAMVEDGDAVLVGGRKTGAFSFAMETAMDGEPATPAEPAEPAPEPEPAPAEPAPALEPAPAPEPETPAPPQDDEALMAALMEEGEVVFRRTANCAGCHGNEGQGGFGPALAGNDYLAGVGGVIGIILGGFEDHGMPAFADDLNDREVAAVATFVRNAWGNDYGIVREAWVATRR